MQQSAPQSKSHLGRNAVIVVALLAFILFVPVVPYTFSSGSFFGFTSKATGDVSPSYVMFHCGMVVNVQGSASFSGYTTTNASSNPGWVCGKSS